MPLTDAEEAELAVLDAKYNRSKLGQQSRPATIAEMRRREEQPGFNKTANQRLGEAIQAEEQRLAESGAPSIFDQQPVDPDVYRYGGPLAVGLMSGGASIPVQMLAGAASAGLGETGAQAVEDKGFRPREIAGAIVRGAAPVFKGGLGGLLKTSSAAGATGLGGGMFEGRVEGVGSGLREAAIPGALTGLLGGAGKAAGALGDAFGAGATRAQAVENIGPGVQATIGQAFPMFAGLEARVASQTGSQELREQLRDQSEAIAKAVQGITGVAAENYPNLVSRISQTIGNLGPETAARLKNEAQNVNSAFAAVEKARSEAQKSLAQEALAEAQQSFQKAVEVETLKGSFVEGIARRGMQQPFQSATMGREVEDMVEKTRDAFRSHASGLYAPLKSVEDLPVFNIGAPAGKNLPSVEDEILGLLNRYPVLQTGEQSRVFTPYLRKLEEIFASRNPTSLNDLRAIRDQLYEASDAAGQAFGKSTQRDIRNVANRITQTIDFQAPQALGQKNADALKAANEFYSKFRGRFDEFGVSQAFKPERMETAQMAETVTGRVARQGTETPAFLNATTLLEDLKAAKVAGVPDARRLADITRSGIVDRSINPATGEIDLMRLAGDLNNIAQQGGGGLHKLGFGNTSELNRFVKYIQNLPAEQAKGPEAVLNLLKTGTPAGFAVASRAVRTLPDLATVDSVLQTLEKQAVAGSKAAQDTLLQIRAREIEDLLLKATTEGRGANLGSLAELADPAMRDNVEQIIGRNLMLRIDSMFLPGFRVIEEGRQAAGMAGSTVRGAALERVGRAVAEAPAQIATGNAQQAVRGMVGNFLAAGAYNLVARAFAKGAGVTGLKNRQEFFNKLAEIAQKPQPQQIQLLRRYIGEESEQE